MAFVQGVLGLLLIVVIGAAVALAVALAGTIALAAAVACGVAFLAAGIIVFAFAIFLLRRRFRSARLMY